MANAPTVTFESARIFPAVKSCDPISKLPDASKLVTPYILTESSTLSPIWIAFAAPSRESSFILPTDTTASSLKFRLSTAFKIRLPLTELIVFPSIRTLSISNCPAVMTAVPILIGPKPSAMEPLSKAPVVVKEEFTTLVPSVSLLNT